MQDEALQSCLFLWNKALQVFHTLPPLHALYIWIPLLICLDDPLLFLLYIIFFINLTSVGCRYLSAHSSLTVSGSSIYHTLYLQITSGIKKLFLYQYQYIVTVRLNILNGQHTVVLLCLMFFLCLPGICIVMHVIMIFTL